MSKQQELTENYFNEIAKDWRERAYDPDGKYLVFPSSKVRQDIVIAEMEKLKIGKRVIDLGCGTGEFVIDLLQSGYSAVGVDISSAMIAEARSKIDGIPNVDVSSIFQEGDVMSLDMDGQFDAVVALGLLEYLTDGSSFLGEVKSLLRDSGFAFIECRNKLFNVCSANKYTLDEAKSGELEKLISELEDVEKYSPTTINELAQAQASLSNKDTLFTINDILGEYIIPEIKYPDKMIRKQHTPARLDKLLNKVGLELQYVIYYHYHPYLPRWGKYVPVIFNKLGVYMQPLGYTPLGATMCSAFVAVIKKLSGGKG